MAGKYGHRGDPTGGSQSSSPDYPEMENDLNDFVKTLQDLYIADDLMREIGDYAEDKYEYDYGYDEYDFIASGVEEDAEDYVYNKLGLPEYNQTKRKVREIAKKIGEGTGREELMDEGRYSTWSNLVKFAEENGIEFHRKSAPIDKHDLFARLG